MSTFPAKLSPSPSLAVNFFALIRCLGRASASLSSAYQPCLDFQHHYCTACWEIATSFGSVRSFPHAFHSYTSPQPLWPTTQISHSMYSSVVTTSKTCHGRSRNSSRVKSQGYFVSWRSFFQFNEHFKFVNEVQHLTRFIQKVGSELPSSLIMLIRQLLKMKNGCQLTKNRRYTIFESLLQFNEAKWQRHNDVSSKLEPSVF